MLTDERDGTREAGIMISNFEFEKSKPASPSQQSNLKSDWALMREAQKEDVLDSNGHIQSNMGPESQLDVNIGGGLMSLKPTMKEISPSEALGQYPLEKPKSQRNDPCQLQTEGVKGCPNATSIKKGGQNTNLKENEQDSINLKGGFQPEEQMEERNQVQENLVMSTRVADEVNKIQKESEAESNRSLVTTSETISAGTNFCLMGMGTGYALLLLFFVGQIWTL